MVKKEDKKKQSNTKISKSQSMNKSIQSAVKRQITKEVDEAEKNISQSVNRKLAKAVEKEFDEAEKSIKQSFSRKVEKAVEKEVDEAQKEITHDIKRELVRSFHKRFDIVENFRKLRSHHKLIFAFIVGFGVVSFWRGTWLFIDLAFFPDHPWIRSLFATLLGLTILTASGVMLRTLTNTHKD